MFEFEFIIPGNSEGLIRVKHVVGSGKFILDYVCIILFCALRSILEKEQGFKVHLIEKQYNSSAGEKGSGPGSQRG